MTRQAVTVALHQGQVYCTDDNGMGVLIGDTIWPMLWPTDRVIKRPEVGSWVHCLLTPDQTVPPGYTVDHLPTVQVWTPARVPADHKTRGGARK